MSIWLIFLGLTFIAFLAGILYLISRVGRFNFIKKLSKDKKWTKRGISLALILVVVAALIIIWSMINAMIVLLHFVMIWLICDLIAWICSLVTGQKSKASNLSKPYYTGIIAVSLTIIYLCICYFLAHNVWITQYKLSSDKNIQPLRIALLADSHVGTLEDGDGFAKKISVINDYNPDVVILAGDFVDDSSPRDVMTQAATALGNLNSKHGVYYVFGNHDRGYYQNGQKPLRGYNADELQDTLEEAGVHVMMDDILCPCNGYAIIGRLDKSFENTDGRSREPINSLMTKIDDKTYSIIIDHQPGDYDNEASAGADLVLSGHTHGGQMIPITWVGEWLGMNDSTYGLKHIGNTDFITTSGISDWEIQFKSGCKSEIVIIDID